MRSTILIFGEPATFPPLLSALNRETALKASGSNGDGCTKDVHIAAYTEPDLAIEDATRFAMSDVSCPTDRLIVFILQPGPAGDWPSASAAATLWAFTRHAALAWAPRGVRVNAIGLGISPTGPWQAADPPTPALPNAGTTIEADLSATILAMWRWPSMTGQLIRLGA